MVVEETALAQLDFAVGQAIASARSDNTRRSYACQWDAWSRWCGEANVVDLPGDPENVARYLTWLAHRGAAVATVRLAATAIATGHRDAGVPDPCAHQGVRLTLKGLARQFARPQRQAAPLGMDALNAVRATASLPRVGRGGRLESLEAAAERGSVDIALVCALSDAGLRRSEAAALVWGDINKVEPDGSGRLTVRRSKTDQTAEGRVVALTPSTVRALEAIRPAVDPETGEDLEDIEERPVFGLSDSQIGRRVKQATIAAGLGPDFSGHSGRIGLAHRMAQAGAPTSAVMKQGRWESPTMVARYTRHEEAGLALRWLQ